MASLQVQSHAQKTKLRLAASGLEAGSEYSLSLNGSVVTTGTADEKGRLKVGWELENPMDILSLQSVALLSAGGETIVTAAFP